MAWKVENFLLLDSEIPKNFEQNYYPITSGEFYSWCGINPRNLEHWVGNFAKRTVNPSRNFPIDLHMHILALLRSTWLFDYSRMNHTWHCICCSFISSAEVKNKNSVAYYFGIRITSSSFNGLEYSCSLVWWIGVLVACANIPIALLY